LSVSDCGRGDGLGNFLRRIGRDVDPEVSGDLSVQLDGNGEVAQALDWFIELNLAAIHFKALGSEFAGNVGGGNGAEELAVFA
jgi:hypothetical protein